MHYAIIKSSGRKVRVKRMGRLLIVFGEVFRRGMLDACGYEPIHTCKYDNRFILLPKVS
jgi:hypothetical protein